MSKNVKSKVAYLEGLAKKVKNENKNKADKLIQLYKDRKISQATTAEKQISNFIEYNSAKDRCRKTIDQIYDTVTAKYEEAEPLNERMSISSSSSSSSNKYIRSVEIKGEDKEAPLELNGIRVFITIHNASYKILYKDAENIAKNRASFKLQTVCKYSYASKKGEDDAGYDKMELIKLMMKTSGVNVEVSDDDGHLAKAFVSSKSMGSSLISLDDTLQSQKIEVNETNHVNLDSLVVSRIDQIIIVIYRTQKSRGSSYIPTPGPFTNPRCGLINIQNDDDKCVYWCMKYHASTKEKHHDRISVLKKLRR
jgi:hypothetical protein